MNHVQRSRSIVLLAAAMYLTAASQPISLSDAARLALEQNERIAQYRERASQKKFQNLESWGNFLPSLTLSGSVNHLDSPVQIDLSPVRDAMIRLQASSQTEFANVYNRMGGGPGLTAAQRSSITASNIAALDALVPAFVQTVKQQDHTSASFIATQPLFLGGKLIAAKKYAAAELTSSELELHRIQQEVQQEVVVNYYSVVLLTEMVRTRRQVLEGLQHHQQDARRLQQEGLIAAHQTLRADVAVAEAERNLHDDENRRMLALLAFRTSLGLDESASVDVADTLRFIALEDSLPAFQERALREQPLLQILSEKRTAAAQKFNAERADFLPQVAAFGKYEIYPQYLSMLEPRWVVGVQFSVNLFQGFKKYSRLQAASHLEDEVEHLRRDTERKLSLLISKSHADMSNALHRYKRLEPTVALARENHRLMSARFSTGLGTALDVIDAELLLEKNLVERSLSLYDYYRAAAELYTASGNTERLISQLTAQEN